MLANCDSHLDHANRLTEQATQLEDRGEFHEAFVTRNQADDLRAETATARQAVEGRLARLIGDPPKRQRRVTRRR